MSTAAPCYSAWQGYGTHETAQLMKSRCASRCSPQRAHTFIKFLSFHMYNLKIIGSEIFFFFGNHL